MLNCESTNRGETRRYTGWRCRVGLCAALETKTYQGSVAGYPCWSLAWLSRARHVPVVVWSGLPELGEAKHKEIPHDQQQQSCTQAC